MREIKNAIALFVLIVVLLATFAIAANAQTTNEAVCKLYRTGTQRHSGSGTFVGVSDDLKLGLVISCYHVCGGKSSMDCYFKNAPGLESQPFNGRVVKLDARYDLAAMIIPNPGFPPAAIGDFQKHEGLYAAAGYGGGKYSAAIGPVYNSDSATLWTRTGIWPGHSGGGLFDPFGRWCGVTNWNNGSRGPNPNGFTKSRSGVALQNFVTEAAYECGPFRKLFNRGGGGGGGDCPDGICPDPSIPGAGYGQVPGYQPLTPLASQPGAVVPQVAPQVQPAPFAQQITVTPPIAQPAPVPDAQKLPVESPIDDDRVARLESMMRQIAQKLDIDVESTEQDESGKLLATLPIVELSLKYPDGTSKAAVIDLRSRVLREFGADEPSEK